VSRPGYSTSAVVQVQKGAPAKLLIGTDLLSQLGHLFTQTSIEGDDHDMLTATSGTDDNSTTITAIRDNSTTSTVISDDSTTSATISDNSATSTAISDNSTTSMVSEDNSTTGAVVHQKMTLMKNSLTTRIWELFALFKQ